MKDDANKNSSATGGASVEVHVADDEVELEVRPSQAIVRDGEVSETAVQPTEQTPQPEVPDFSDLPTVGCIPEDVVTVDCIPEAVILPEVIMPDNAVPYCAPVQPVTIMPDNSVPYCAPEQIVFEGELCADGYETTVGPKKVNARTVVGFVFSMISTVLMAVGIVFVTNVGLALFLDSEAPYLPAIIMLAVGAFFSLLGIILCAVGVRDRVGLSVAGMIISTISFLPNLIMSFACITCAY